MRVWTPKTFFSVLITLSIGIGLWAIHGTALGQTVIINGIPLVTTRTPVMRQGSLLLPMRDVFEALQSEVKWFASEQKVMAIRGQTTIELWLGRTTATINGRPIQLPVAPTLINGSTYVPLRFPAEAFGGSVEWQAATRTVVISIPPLTQPPGETRAPETPSSAGAPSSVGPTTPPETTPQPPQPKRVEGTLLQILANPPTIIITETGTGLAQALAVRPNTVLTRHADNQQPQAATLAEAMPGDYVNAVLSPEGWAQSIDFVYGEYRGFVAGIAENSILLKDNKVFTLSPNVAVMDEGGNPVALSEVPNAAFVILRYQPTTRTVFEMRVRMPAPTQTTTPAQPAKPQILVVGILNPSPIFKAGDRVQIQLQGTPGGAATVNIGDMAQNVALTENPAGVYQAQWTVPPNTNAQQVPLIGNLIVNNVAADPVTSQILLTFDSKPPRIETIVPEANATIDTMPVVIEATFNPLDGAPINPDSARLWLNGVQITEGLEVTAEKLSYTAATLPPQEHRVRVAVSDMAGNRAQRDWRFIVQPPPPEALILESSSTRSVSGTLPAGATITVFMRVAQPGGVATFDIGNLRQGLPMNRIAQTDRYTGRYTVQPGDHLLNGRITVHYRAPDGQEASRTLNNPVSIDATLPTQLEISAPANNSQVGATIVVEGVAPATQRVRVTITFRTLGGIVEGQHWQGIVTAGADGAWRTPAVNSKVGFFGKADEYFIKAELLDASNNPVQTKQIRLVK